MRVKYVIEAVCALAASALVLSAGAALAGSPPSSVFVSHTATPTAADKSCATASFSSVQAAIGAVAGGGQVYLCGSAPFAESVAIENKDVRLTGDPGSTLQAPADAAAPTSFFSSQNLATPNAVVSVIGSSNVKLTGLTVEGPFANTGCGGDDYGVLQVGGQLAMSGDTVSNIEAANQAGLGGCQYGVGIQIGRQHWPTTGGDSQVVDFVGNAKVQSTTVGGYQKNGITADGAGSTITATSDTVDGGGQTTVIARNGIQVSRGATGRITGNSVANNEYTGPGGFASSTGVLVFGGCGDPLSANVVVNGNTLTDNDSGVVLANYDSGCDASPATPTDDSVQANTISKTDGETNQSPFTDQFGNDYTGYQVGIGVTGNGDRIKGNTITGTVVGGTDTAYGPQYQPGGNFLGCVDLLTYPPVGAVLGKNRCDGAAVVLPKAPTFASGNNGDSSSSGSASEVSGAAVLTSNNLGFGLASAKFPAGTTFSQLTSLATGYEVTQGTCVGGSPRYQIDLSDGNPAHAVSLYVYFGTPPYGGCSSGPQTEGEVIGGSTAQWFAFGGGNNSNVAMTYSQVLSNFGSYKLLDAQIAVDGGWAQDPMTQTVSITNWEVNGKYFFAG